MKNNQPITQHEVECEESDVFVTRTDTKGVITSANEAFCRIAGFTEQELIGQSHNIVRHPDMPAWAFKSLWDTVKSGRSWRGLVKNRCKNGDYYWVRATVSPVIENNSVVGYLSLRKKPTRKEIADADAIYRANPKAAPKKPFSVSKWFRSLGVKAKINLVIQPLLFVLLSVGTYAVYQKISASIVDDAIVNGNAVAMQVIDSANMMMVTGAISDQSARQLMIKKIIEGQGLSSLKLVRTDQVVKQFGPGLPEECLDDPLIQSTIESALKAGKVAPYTKIQTVDGKPMLRVITPYMVGHDFHGTDCMGCHQVNDRSVNGASDLTINLSANFSRLHNMVVELIVWQIFAQVIIYFLLGWILNRFVISPVKEVRSHLNEVMNGDFSRMVDIDGVDEVGLMLCSVQSTKVLIGAVIDHVRTTARLVNQNAERLSDAVSTAGAVSHAQSEASHSMASSMEEMSASIDSIASNAMEVRRVSNESAQKAESGGVTVSEVVADMGSIGREVTDAANAVIALGVRSNEINEIVKVIKSIADQTNLLALNAAIEAARAGEQGRGFAVVADEVRKLAEKTASSTTTVSLVVEGIRTGTLDAIRMIESAVVRAQHGGALAQTAGVAISSIAEGTGSVLTGVSDIASSIHAQSTASRDIATQIEMIAQQAEENSLSIMSVDESAKMLAHLSGELKKQTDSFTI